MLIYLPVTFEHCRLVHVILVAVTHPDLKNPAGALVIGTSQPYEEFPFFLSARMCSFKFQGKKKNPGASYCFERLDLSLP